MAENKDWKNRIDVNPKVAGGKPVIKGTRITLDFILEILAQGWAVEKILKNYPKLKKEDIKATLQYSSHAIRMENIYTI